MSLVGAGLVWDPVENASLMPWLLGVAALHMAKVASVDRGKMLPGYRRCWVLCSAMARFRRSGVLISVPLLPVIQIVDLFYY